MLGTVLDADLVQKIGTTKVQTFDANQVQKGVESTQNQAQVQGLRGPA